ncbi:MAG: PAS domain S-box protein [Nitrospirae bacterium]|nr:PAS domain S-box protein [Nitrospirota bacterium]
MLNIFAHRASAEMERTRNEKALAESEEKFRTIFDNATDGILLADIEEKMFYTGNTKICEMLGYTLDEIKKLGVMDIHPEKDLPYVIEQFERQVRKEIMVAKDIPLKRKDGSVFYADINASHLTLAGREYMTGIIRDITERKKSEKELKESEKKFRDMAEVALVGVYLIQDGIFRYCNNKLAEIFGYAAEELIDKKGPQDLVYPEDWHIVKENLRRRIEGEIDSIHYSFRGITKDRKTIYVDVYGAKTDYQGRPAVLGTLLDITHRKLAEEEKDRLNKELEIKNRELEQMVYISSHDLRSPLVNIEGYTSELNDIINKILSAVRDGEAAEALKLKVKSAARELPESMNFIRSGVSKMDSLLQGLLEFSHLGHSELKREEIEMNKLISGIMVTFDFAVKKSNAKVVISELPVCSGDKKMIDQVFSNLIGNAVKYLDPRREGVIRIYGHKEDGSLVYCVEDNGIGIAPEYREKIFDIFHQLEPSMQGEGLGLTIVRKIVEMHNGRVWAESEPGKGSKFCVKLPA